MGNWFFLPLLSVHQLLPSGMHLPSLLSAGSSVTPQAAVQREESLWERVREPCREGRRTWLTSKGQPTAMQAYTLKGGLAFLDLSSWKLLLSLNQPAPPQPVGRDKTWPEKDASVVDVWERWEDSLLPKVFVSPCLLRGSLDNLTCSGWSTTMVMKQEASLLPCWLRFSRFSSREFSSEGSEGM